LGVPAVDSAPEVREDAMAVVMIGVDPHKASHTAVPWPVFRARAWARTVACYATPEALPPSA
jgi:hypothetical protein